MAGQPLLPNQRLPVQTTTPTKDIHGMPLTAPTTAPVAQKTPEQIQKSQIVANQTASQKGPAYDVRQGPDGMWIVFKSTDPASLMAQSEFERQQGIGATPTVPPVVGNPLDFASGIMNGLAPTARTAYSATTPQVTPITAPTYRGVGGTTSADSILGYLESGAVRAATPSPSGAAKAAANPLMGGIDWASVDTSRLPGAPGTQPGVGDGNPATAPGAEAPNIDRTRLDPILNSVGGVQQRLLDLERLADGPSAAEAALSKASEEANIRSAIATEASQRSALGQARSARNRGDRALMERQAVGESAFIGQEAARTDALRTAEQEGNLGILRANEADANRRFRADILGRAADLGLNTAALEMNIAETDIASANNWINNEFDKLKADGQLDLGFAQLDQQKAEALLGFTQEMAALQFNYDKMNVDDQNLTDQLIMQKYGIDQQTMVALKQIKESGKFDWGGLLQSFVGGAGSGATAGIVSAISDRRAKRNFSRASADELDELLGAFKGETYEYKDQAHGKGLRFGPMAQALEKTRLGRGMVVPHPSGYRAVDTGAVALATASAVAQVHERLAALEGAR